VSGFENVLLSCLVNSMWQVPLLLACGFLAARLVRTTGPLAEHRVWVGVLLCQAVLPAASSLPWERLHIAWPWRLHSVVVRESSVSVLMGPGTGLGTLRLPAAVIAAITVVYAGMIVFCSLRFVWRCARLAVLARGTEPLELTGEAALSREQWSRRLGIGPVAVFSSAQIFAPMTIGCIRKCVLLPTGMLTGLAHSDVDTAIAHELAHVRRNDFLKNLIYELLSLPVNYHPAFWVVRQRMTETREMVCDAVAAEFSGSRQYARSLLRLASLLLEGKPMGVPHAIGVFDANTLERRVMKLTETKKPTGRLRRGAALAACILLGIATASTLVALRFDVNAAVANGAASEKPEPRSVPPATMQDHLLTKVTPKYPPDAKKAGIQGTVVLEAIIGDTGRVENLKVVSGPNELVQSAMDAVRQWTYKPVLLNGAAIEVKTTVSVFYTLEK
jgi:bla regulator protein blaR1